MEENLRCCRLEYALSPGAFNLDATQGVTLNFRGTSQLLGSHLLNHAKLGGAVAARNSLALNLEHAKHATAAHIPYPTDTYRCRDLSSGIRD